MACALVAPTTVALFRRQGFTPAKRTLQATQRTAPRTVMSSSEQKNVLGGKLECCCTKPMTGFYRDGYCRVGPEDHGVHSVCSEMTTEFLEFSASRGNDLRGVVSAGERWCLCVSRWKEALDAGKAPPIVLESCSEEALKVVSIEQLKQHVLQTAQ
ncbi:hypothetical protein ABBQ38_014889 [Trebouxia sp. C0009 RCD-2024]